jgi:uncharacterized protein GlcG (DUF336 family)
VDRQHRHRHRAACEYSHPGRQFFGIHASNHGRVVVFAGGSIVGAIGVSGGIDGQD